MLHLGADDFLFRDREGRLGVVAGFPWFGEWGRDTFVSLPGLTLGRGRVEECGEALEGALRFLADGRLPHIVGPDRKTSVYGSLDTPLWFAWAVEAYDEAGGNPRRVEDALLPAVEEIARALIDGRRPGAICDDEGLVCSRPGAESLTWMDARVDGRPVTPRRGAAVEVNALWYSLLRFLERKHRSAGRERDARRWGAMRRRVGEAFLARFWLPDTGRLADVWNDGAADPTVRPNMVIAAALASSPLDRPHRLAVVETAERELLTPLGLRTLSPSSPDYQGRYSGGPVGRDRAYHQGTVWPWLLGFYVEACLRARGSGPSRSGAAARAPALVRAAASHPRAAPHLRGLRRRSALSPGRRDRAVVEHGRADPRVRHARRPRRCRATDARADPPPDRRRAGRSGADDSAPVLDARSAEDRDR